MSSVQAPPIYQPVVDPKSGIATNPWILFFNQLFAGDGGIAWIPTFSGLTIVGATPQVTGRVYQISQALAVFVVDIVPGTNTSAVAGTTFINNFPLKMKGNGVCFAVAGHLGTPAGMCDQTSNGIYVPAWTTVISPVTVLGIVEAS